MSPIIQYLKELFAAAPEENKGAIQVQIVNTHGKAYSGALRQHPTIDDLYLMVLVGQRQNAHGKAETFMLTAALEAKQIVEVHVTMAAEEPSRILIPQGGGQVLPAHRG